MSEILPLKKEFPFYYMQDYYPMLSSVSFPTVFVPVTSEILQALAAGDVESSLVKKFADEKLAPAMRNIPSPRFVSVDIAAAADSPAFSAKRGAVGRAMEAWQLLASSPRIRSFAAEGKIKAICIRPFRRMDVPREFRLFIRDGKLAGMSQYHLVRHFRRLVERENEYMTKAKAFVEEIAPHLPARDIVADIYFTHSRRIILLDLNIWGEPTDPKMFKWDSPFNGENPLYGIVPSPRTVSGEVKVKF
jgi:hypothetical protein